MPSDYVVKSTCRLCESSALEKVVELTPTPPGNNFLRADELPLPEPVYPLEVNFCTRCAHVQLGHVVEPTILFRGSYCYASATSPVFVDHLGTYAREMIRRYALPVGGLVGDIGSNDGTCLRFFKDAGFRVLGIDPATELAQRANEQGIETLAAFFDLDCAKRIRESHGPTTFVTSHNALAHIDDLSGVVEGVKHWLADEGLFGLEVGYFLDVYQNTWFDTIYHEHVDFHTVAPLDAFFARHGMEIVSAQRVAPQGGSIRLIVQRAGGRQTRDGSVGELIALERRTGLDRPETLRGFNARINKVRADLSGLVRDLKAKGHTIAAFGAPTKSTTLLAHFELGSGILDFIVDDNPMKQGLFSPLFHIPVLHPDEVYRRRPDYLVLLAWNFAESIMKKHARYREEGGRFILPMPEARIVA
jgi:C-methyltransferase C-terminal domain/Putative zinc binding domain/Methyltransferase domain